MNHNVYKLKKLKGEEIVEYIVEEMFHLSKKKKQQNEKEKKPTHKFYQISIREIY